MEVHNCIHCGTESQPTWRFCRRCGTALENLEQLPTVAHCSNCASPVADGWRFCANCGTGTESATPGAAGLSEDAVAELIAAPGPASAEPAQTETASAAAPPEAAPVAAEPAPQPEQVPFAAEPEPEPEPVDHPPIAADLEPPTSEPTISTPQVSFEPAAGVPSPEEAGDDGAPPSAISADAAPPPPPPDPTIEAGDIATARAQTEAPPAAPVAASREPIAEIIAPQDDPFAGTSEDADTFEVGEEVVAAAVDDPSEPVITIPGRDEHPEILAAVPRPIGQEPPTRTEVPRPIGLQRDEAEGTSGDEPQRRVAVPDREPVQEDEESELPPLDARFRNPGLFGQGVQLLLAVSAVLSVAMMVALIVLNNRLDTYATSGESLSRVQSAESMVNTWMRPILIVAIVITYALLAMWSRRVLNNLHAFNNGMDETPLWMWMMPFVNMWVLFRHFDLAWKASDYYARGARTWQRSVPDVWTVLFVLLPTLGFVLVLYGWVNGADTFSMAIDSNAFSMVGYFIITIGLLAGIRAISNIIERQRTRVEGIS